MLLKNFTLLYVEDDYDAQEHMQMILEDDIKEMYQAYNGEEGLRLFKEKKPDIIVTDINMPVMDGLSMANEIKKINNEQPIVVISALDNRETLLKAINMGIDYFVPKPIDIDILYQQLEKIAQNLQNKIYADNARKMEKEKLCSLAYFDPLTQIFNRYLFNMKLNEAIERVKRYKSRFSLLFIDLDNFKSINDTYGHAAGDVVLQSVAHNILQVIRKGDVFARISGDEFALIVEDIDDISYLNDFVKKIIEAVSKPIIVENISLQITCSIGISRCPKDADTAKTLLDIADHAMYRAKQEGKADFVIAKSV